MQIIYSEKGHFFHLSTSEMSYVFGITPDKRLVNLYWGAQLSGEESILPLAEEVYASFKAPGDVDVKLVRTFEITSGEPFDYTSPALKIVFPDGVRSLRLLYQSCKIEENHLTVTLRDAVYPFEVELHYKGYADLPLISRYIVLNNMCGEPVTVDAAKSASFHLPGGESYRLTHLSGNQCAEYTKNTVMLTQARTVIQNNRVTCGAAQATPFFALDKEGKATETSGEIYFGVLSWSGDFSIVVENQYPKQVSVIGGMGTDFENVILKPGETLKTPDFTAGFVSCGFERMSEVFYDWQFDHICPRGRKTDKAHAERPVIYNSWYPFSFNVNEENCISMIDECASIGAELFVIDDGWMPGRTNDHTGLGDWVADSVRFPHGLRPVADYCHKKGLLFGLWVEPEMVNPDSDLYRAHPDWVIHDPTRPRTEQRNQLVLNLAREDVYEWMVAMLDRVVTEYKLDYLKWDMNRYVSEDGWPDAPAEDRKSLSFRYTRNLFRVWEHLNAVYPDLLLENCASGGGRSDFGMVPYADRINRSDNADPVDVMVIHEGFSMLFIPKTAGGAGNIAPAKHHIHMRETPLSFRSVWGMTGSMSIGINLLTADKDTKEELKRIVARFKTLRGDLQNAYVYRIASAYDHPYVLFEYVRRDRKAFTLFAFGHGMRAWDLQLPRFRMRGLLPDAVYVSEDGRELTGEALMQIGLKVSLRGDYASDMSTWKIKEIQ